MTELVSEDLVLNFDAEGVAAINHYQGRLPEILDAIGKCLSANKALNIFVHAGRLVRIYENPGQEKGVFRAHSALVIHPIEKAHLAELIGRAANHFKFDCRSKDWVKCDCPSRVAEAYLSRGFWPELRELSGFIESPTMRLDGSLLDVLGYDQSTGLYFAPSDDTFYSYVGPIPKPTFDDGASALEKVLSVFDTFPFVSEEDKAAAVASVITGMIRRLLPSAPMFAVTAPTPGTGKTLLAETPAMISTGRRSSVLSLGPDDAETQKRLGGVLLAGDPVILLDNIERPLGGDLLCQVTTQPSVSLRPLGGSNVLSVSTNSLLMATGNNLSIIGDLKRRVVLIRLDANTERPEHRKFSKNHIDEVLQLRGELIGAALTIPMAYIEAGCPEVAGHVPFGSFEEWDRLVRRPLLWLGLPDPLGGAQALRESDPDIEAMRSFFNSWISVPELNRAVTVSEIIGLGMEYMPGGDPACPDLRDALQLICSEKVNSRRLGYWLKAHRDRIVDGLQLINAGLDGHAKIARWQIRKCG